MFNALMGLGWGIVGFAIIIGIGTTVLSRFGGAVGCEGTYGYSVWNATQEKCQAGTNSSNVTDPSGSAYTNINYLNTQLGTTGLAGWAPAIIAFSVGMLFLGGFLIRKGSQRQY